MMSKEAKKNYVEEMKKNFTDNESVMIARYQGLNVNELDFKKELREKGILFKITKNKITKIALKETSKKILKSTFQAQPLQLSLPIQYLQLKFWQNFRNPMINLKSLLGLWMAKFWMKKRCLLLPHQH